MTGQRSTRSVWKYEIQIAGEFAVTMPDCAQVLHVDVQHGKPWMWALVNPANKPTQRTFYVAGTGHPIDPALIHLGSFMLDGGAFVGHLFEHATALL